MGKYNLLLRCDTCNFEPIRWPVQPRPLKFIAPYLGILIVAEVRQGAKEHRACMKHRVGILLWQILIQARHDVAQRKFTLAAYPCHVECRENPLLSSRLPTQHQQKWPVRRPNSRGLTSNSRDSAARFLSSKFLRHWLTA